MIIVIGQSSNSEQIEEELGLEALVQVSMVRAGLPKVIVEVIDSTVVLKGIVETQELKEAAIRIALNTVSKCFTPIFLKEPRSNASSILRVKSI